MHCQCIVRQQSGPMQSIYYRVVNVTFSNVTEGFVTVIATIDVSVNICRKELRATRRATCVWRSFVHVAPAVLASVVVALQKCHQLARSSWP